MIFNEILIPQDSFTEINVTCKKVHRRRSAFFPKKILILLFFDKYLISHIPRLLDKNFLFIKINSSYDMIKTLLITHFLFQMTKNKYDDNIKIN